MRKLHKSLKTVNSGHHWAGQEGRDQEKDWEREKVAGSDSQSQRKRYSNCTNNEHKAFDRATELQKHQFNGQPYEKLMIFSKF